MPFFSNPRPSPFHRTPPAGLCWVCTRHIGPALSCPYCDAAQPFRSVRIAFRLIALTLAVSGLAALLVAARQHPSLPATPIAQLNPHAPFTTVRIEGRIERSSSRTNLVPIHRLRDESGTIRIFIDRAIGPHPDSRLGPLRNGQPLAILGSAALDSRNRLVFYGLKWSRPNPITSP